MVLKPLPQRAKHRLDDGEGSGGPDTSEPPVKVRKLRRGMSEALKVWWDLTNFQDHRLTLESKCLNRSKTPSHRQL